MTTRRGVPVEQKVGSWLSAYSAIRDELTPPAARRAATSNGVYATEAQFATQKVMAANDRTAALVAALLVGAGGVRLIPEEET